jgi:ankyrin repeat protein
MKIAQQKKVKEVTEQAMKMIELNSGSQLDKLLNELPEDVKMTDIVDKDGFSLLHMAVFLNKTAIVENLIAKASSHYQVYEVAEWVN